MVAKIQYVHITTQFNSFNTDQKSIRKSKKISFSQKKKNTKLTLNFPSITRAPLRENYGTPRKTTGRVENLKHSLKSTKHNLNDPASVAGRSRLNREEDGRRQLLRNEQPTLRTWRSSDRNSTIK